MTWRSVCDAWVGELQDRVDGLAPPVTVHRYAPWSLEQLYVQGTQRHLAIWPTTEAETSGPLVAVPSALYDQSFVVVVWEGVPYAPEKLKDDPVKDAEWLDLHEAIRSRFEDRSTIRLGDTPTGSIMDTRYAGGSFPAHTGLRVMELRFTVRVQRVFT